MAISLVTAALSAAATEHASTEADAFARVGARIFFDTRFSSDGRVSCATCHVPERAFSDGEVTPMGVHGKRGFRNTPSLINAASQTALFWDGRRSSLETQAGDPFINALEHGLRSHDEVAQRVNDMPAYREAFTSLTGRSSVQAADVFRALAAFQRTLQSHDSPFERYLAGRDAAALSPAALRGYQLFVGRAECSGCHLVGGREAALTDGKFHAIGVGTSRLGMQLPSLIPGTAERARSGQQTPDANTEALGRFLVTFDSRDIGAFRTPPLHNVAVTAPYMHDGSVATLEAAVDQEVHYRRLRSGRALILTRDERSDLVEFLKSMTSATLANLAERARRLAE